jgi:hypothetical protein
MNWLIEKLKQWRRFSLTRDEPLVIAHLMGGANGLDFKKPEPDAAEIERRVRIAIRYGREILKQLAYDKNKKEKQTTTNS